MDKQKVDGTVWVYDTPQGTTMFLTNSMACAAGWVERGVVDITVEVDAINKAYAIAELKEAVNTVRENAATTERNLMQQIEAIEGASDE